MPSLILTDLFNSLAFISASAVKAWNETVLGSVFEIYRVKQLMNDLLHSCLILVWGYKNVYSVAFSRNKVCQCTQENDSLKLAYFSYLSPASKFIIPLYFLNISLHLANMLKI